MEARRGSGLGGLTSLSDSEAPDSTMLAARDKTSSGDSGSGMSSVLAITITTCRDTLVSNAGKREHTHSGWEYSGTATKIIIKL